LAFWRLGLWCRVGAAMETCKIQVRDAVIRTIAMGTNRSRSPRPYSPSLRSTGVRARVRCHPGKRATKFKKKARGGMSPWSHEQEIGTKHGTSSAYQGKLIGPMPPLKAKEIWSIRVRLQVAHRIRDLALFNESIRKYGATMLLSVLPLLPQPVLGFQSLPFPEGPRNLPHETSCSP
jgi:hypothetical protein